MKDAAWAYVFRKQTKSMSSDFEGATERFWEATSGAKLPLPTSWKRRGLPQTSLKPGPGTMPADCMKLMQILIGKLTNIIDFDEQLFKNIRDVVHCFHVYQKLGAATAKPFESRVVKNT